MGRVYEAEHVRLPKRFAIKVMQSELVKHPDALARFEREAQAVARVTSEHVIEVVDLVRLKDGRPCLVTELLEGQELGEMLEKSGKLALPMAITIGRQICRGLAAAHAVGIVHRDLKPSNLFLVNRADGRPFVKILDFGVAKLSDGAQLTRTGMVVGTPAYMSPEQARGSVDVDERADVYSLGAVLYHMLTGSPPFTGDEPAVVLTRVLSEDPLRPRDLNRSIPDAVEHLVQRAMARAEEGRPRSVEELDRELAVFDVAQASDASGAPPSSAPVHVSSDVLSVPSVRSSPIEAPLHGARWSRFGATWIAIAWSLVLGTFVFASAAGGMSLYGGRPKLRVTELGLLGLVAGIVALLALISSLRGLSLRWRSAPAIDRLGGALASGFLALIGTAGVLTLAQVVYGIVGPPLRADLASYAQLAIVGAPLLLGLIVLAVSTRRANRLG